MIELSQSLIAINKPKGMTSHDVVNKIRKITGIKKVGHAGTLDPLATGVLVIAIGRASTKKISETVKKEKEYKAVIKLGEESTTDDQEGIKTIRVTHDTELRKPTKKEIQEELKMFIGVIQQIPPQFSAIKVKGKTAYKVARAGGQIELKAREVEIKKIMLESFEYPFLKITVTTGPGVYIRSLARDIGKSLGTGAYLFDLQRTRVGEFTIGQSIKLEDLRT